jgi:hypothetical protein
MSDFDQKAQIGFDLTDDDADFGSFFDSVGNFFGGIVGTATDAVGSVWSGIPGSGAVDDITGAATQAMNDFANTAVGQTVLRALATSLTGGLAPYLGPQLATVAWAVPGLAAGNTNFIDAWSNEFKWRVETTAQQLGADVGKLIADQVTKTLAQLHLERAINDKITESVQQLAEQFGIREDAAALVKSAWNGDYVPDLSNFNLTTGQEGSMDPNHPVISATINLSKKNPKLAIANTMRVNRHAPTKMGRAKQKSNVGSGILGAILGTGGAFLFGASMPIALGVGALLGGSLYLKK